MKAALLLVLLGCATPHPCRPVRMSEDGRNWMCCKVKGGEVCRP